MSAEAASHHHENEDHHTRPHLHIVENHSEHGPEEGADILVGFEPEVRRDHVAIQKFISTRDELLAKGVSFADAILDAARSYDETLSIDAEHWRPKVVDGITDFNPGITSGNYNLKGGVTLLETAPSEALVSAVTEARDRATQTVRDRYEALRQAGHDTFVERNAEAEEIQAINDKYKAPTSSASHTVLDTESYTVASTGESRDTTVEDRDLQVKDQLDSADAAIEASYRVRQQALAEGKTVDEAYDLGATEYKRVMDATGNKTTAAGRREAAAIIAFNEARDKFVSHDLRNKKYDHAKALHGAVTNYVETLEHVEHLGHENPDSIFADGHHGDGGEHGHPDTPLPPDSNTEREQPERKKVRDVLRKVGYAITREYHVLTSRDFDQAPKSPSGMGEFGMDGDDYVLSLTESLGDALNRKPKWFEAWRTKANTRKTERKERKDRVKAEKQAQKDQFNEQLNRDVQARLDTIRQSKWGRDGKEMIKNIKNYNKEEAARRAEAGERIARQQAQTEFDNTQEEARRQAQAEQRRAVADATNEESET